MGRSLKKGPYIEERLERRRRGALLRDVAGVEPKPLDEHLGVGTAGRAQNRGTDGHPSDATEGVPRRVSVGGARANH